MRRAWVAALLALPVAGLAAGAGWQAWAQRGTSLWAIPATVVASDAAVRAVTVRYEWRTAGPVHLCREGGCRLCLTRDGGVVTATAAPRERAACPAVVDPAAGTLMLRYAPEGVGRPLDAVDRVGLTAARVKDRGLPPAGVTVTVTARLTRDGRLVPVGVEAP